MLIFYVSNAQDISYKQLTDQDGLPSNEVYNMIQDSRGFIWIGTDKGLCRYDGFRFKNYSCKTQASLAVSDISEDAFGNIWLCNFSGQLFFIQHDTLKELVDFRGLHNGVVKYCFNEKKKKLYATTNNSGVYVYEIESKKSGFLNERKSTHNSAFATLALLESSKVDYMYGGSGKKLVKLGPTSIQTLYNTENYTALENKTQYYPSNFFNWGKETYIYFSFKDELTLIRNDSIISLKPHFFKDFGLGVYNTIRVIDENRISLNSTAGCIIVNKSLKASSPLLLKQVSISDLLIDHEGNYWFSSTGAGIFFNPGLELKVYNQTISHLPYDGISAIKRFNENTLLIGFQNGNICLYDPKKDSLIAIVKDPYPKSIYDFIVNQDGTFFAYNTILYYYRSMQQKPELLFGGIRKIYQNGNIACVASSNSAILMGDLLGNKFLADEWKNNFKKDSMPSIGIQKKYSFIKLREARANDIISNEAGTEIYVAYADGLCYHEASGSTPVMDGDNKIFATSLLYFKDTIVCGTTGNGIYFIWKHKIIKHLSTEQGLSNPTIQKIFIHGNTLWVVQTKGIDAYDLISKKIRRYNVEDGLYAKDYFAIEEMDGYIYLATNRGMIAFPENFIDKNDVAPQLIIEDFLVNEKEINNEKRNQISYWERNIKIHFHAFCYRSQKNYHIQYRLLGNDSTWIQTGPDITELTFASLMPGTYRFQIMAINEDGRQSEIKEINFCIRKTFWQQWWFWFICFIIFMLLIVGFFQRRIAEQKKKNMLALEKAKAERDLRESEMASLKVQMNPHFIFNALNSIQEFILTNEKKSANLYLGKFSDLMRMTLEMSQQQSINLKDELKVLNLYLELENLRFMNEMKYEINLHNITNPEEIKIPSMLVQPYVENAIKHGLLHKKTDKLLRIDFDYQKEKRILLCVIDDNGIGREKAMELKKYRPTSHQSFATSATQKRLELLNFGREKSIAVTFIDKKNEHDESMGTRVELEIPI